MTTTPMDVETQKFMALEGVHTWAHGVLEQASRLNELLASLSDIDQVTTNRRAFQRDRQSFLTSARSLLAHIDWCKELAFLDNSLFDEFETFRTAIKDLRDMNQHVIEYFQGTGRVQERWWHHADESESDASATNGTRIGGRLDWNELAAVASRLIEKLPPIYKRQVV